MTTSVEALGVPPRLQLAPTAQSVPTAPVQIFSAAKAGVPKNATKDAASNK